MGTGCLFTVLYCTVFTCTWSIRAYLSPTLSAAEWTPSACCSLLVLVRGPVSNLRHLKVHFLYIIGTMVTILSLKYVLGTKKIVSINGNFGNRAIQNLMTRALQFSNKLHICGGLREKSWFPNKVIVAL